MNFIRLYYLCRDHANQKQYNSVIFHNPQKRMAEEIEIIIKAHLIDHLWLIHSEWGLPDLRTVENKKDQPYHEFVGVQNTEEILFEKVSSIEELLERIKKSR